VDHVPPVAGEDQEMLLREHVVEVAQVVDAGYLEQHALPRFHKGVEIGDEGCANEGEEILLV
jgi:hypothetical protein